jgi:lactaldehyde dehydrogenase/glycolaldehyde dehydrogenase
MVYQETMVLDQSQTHWDQPLHVAGARRRAEGEVVDVVDPATEEVVARVGSATPADVDDAVAAARAAQPAWAATPAVERSAVLRAMADLLERHADELAPLLSLEVGKPIGEARTEVQWAADYARYTAEWDRRVEGEILPSDARAETIHLMRVPLGVVAAICPWNYPLGVLLRKLAPALLTGNAVVAKPSEVAPLTALAFAALVEQEVEPPAGVFNLVTGGGEVGRLLVSNPGVDLVTMTGHRDTGKRVAAAAAENLTRVSLELGGKAPAIVLADADLDLAVSAIAFSRHENAGQVCTCPERVFVEAAVAEEFTERYAAAAARLVVGPPATDPDLGPLVSAPQHEKAAAAVETALADGARLVAGGGRPAGDEWRRGYWFSPTVLTEVTPEMAIMREEVFGPVTPIMPVGSLAEALELANASRYGLSAYVFTNGYRAALRAVHELAAGEIYVNRTHGEALQAHHAGHGDSGLGGEDGKHGLLRYTQLRTAYHRYG